MDAQHQRNEPQRPPQSRHLLETLLRASVHGIVVSDAAQKVYEVNEAFSAFFGRSRREVIGTPLRHWLEQLDGDAPARWAELEERLRREGSAGEIELGMTTRCGVRHLRLDTSLLEPLNDEGPQAIVSIWRDVTARQRAEHWLAGLKRLNQGLLAPGPVAEKLRRITDGLVEIFAADFAGIWITLPADLCDAGCVHATVTEGPHVCRRRDLCLHLTASSGRYPHGDQVQRRVPFGSYDVGRIAAGDLDQLITNDVTRELEALGREGAQERERVAFAGFRLRSAAGESIGVLALFSRHPIATEDAAVLENLSAMASQVIQTASAEDELRRREEQYRRLVTEIPVMVYDGDEQWNALMMSPRAEEITGYSPSEFTAKRMNWVDVIHPDDREWVVEEGSSLTREPRSLVQEYRVVRKDGSVVWVRDQKSSKFHDRRFLGVHGVVEDVTARKRAEEELLASLRNLRESEAALVEAQRVAHVGNWSRDMRSGEVKWSEEMFRIVGIEPQEITLELLMSLVHPDDRALFQRAWHASEEGEAKISVEFRLVPPDGTVRHVHDRWESIKDEEGRELWRFGILQDVSERKQAEEARLRLERQLQHAQKLESLGVLAGGIAHDFNNLLLAVLGNVDLALDGLGPSSPLRDNLEEIEQASIRAAELCKQMLAYSGKGRLVVKPTDLSAVVKEMVHLLEVSISKKAMIELNLAPDLPAIEADPTQLGQVVMNLITNASEALSDDGGTITLTTYATDLERSFLQSTFTDGDLPEGRYVGLEVTDTGCGMDAETRAKIFEPFFTTKFTGRGLGMAAVQGIVRGHGGGIQVLSEPRRGTTVRVLLPASEARVIAAIPGDGPRQDWHGSGTILLVDDEEHVRAVARQMIEKLGFKAVTAADGREALALLRHHEGELVLVLLDMTMPHLDGLETYREMRRLGSEVPVILSSGHSEQDVVGRFADHRLAGFLKKPYRLAALREKIRQVLKL